MEQLSAQDASFLYQETAETPMHVGSVGILDPATATGAPLDLQTAQTFFETRLHLMPMARRRLVHVPFDADYPWWVEDERFDLEYHLREIALPEPADWRQLYTVCARILARPLDMTRPLWEAYLIHGLRNLDGVPANAVALLMKVHHCAIDGASGTDMSISISDLSPEAAPVGPPSRAWCGERLPGEQELLARSLVTNLLRPVRAFELLAASLGSNQRLSRLLRENLPAPQVAVPRTRFNRSVSAHRAMGCQRFALDEVRAIKQELAGVTVNDVALGLCGGTLRRYLDAKGELPAEPLVAMAPISVRKSGADYKLGNQVSAMFVPIGTHIADPMERLEAIREATHSAKQMTSAIGADLMTRYGEFVPSSLSNLGARLTSEYSRANRLAPAFNCSITNVPGPQVPLYMMGCRLVTTIGFGPVAHNMGLIMPIGSYCGEFTISFTACREMLPDPEFFIECLRASFAETRRAALGSDAEVEQKVAAVARDYTRMAEAALEQVRGVRQRAAAAS